MNDTQMGPERTLTKEELMQRRVNDLESTLSRLSGENMTLMNELNFWKKLALGELGIDSAKIERLVNFGNTMGGVATMGPMGRRF